MTSADCTAGEENHRRHQASEPAICGTSSHAIFRVFQESPEP